MQNNVSKTNFKHNFSNNSPRNMQNYYWKLKTHINLVLCIAKIIHFWYTRPFTTTTSLWQMGSVYSLSLIYNDTEFWTKWAFLRTGQSTKVALFLNQILIVLQIQHHNHWPKRYCHSEWVIIPFIFYPETVISSLHQLLQWMNKKWQFTLKVL